MKIEYIPQVVPVTQTTAIRDALDGQDHEFKYNLNRTGASRLPFLLREFAEDLEELLAEGVGPAQRKSIARRADILARGAEEHIGAILERLQYKEEIARLPEWNIENAKKEAVAGIANVEIGDCIDPHGHFVYILWGEDEPIYIGMSSNILSRIGRHMDSSDKRAATKRIQLIRCIDRAKAADTEWSLIGKYCPRLNIAGTRGGSRPVHG